MIVTFVIFLVSIFFLFSRKRYRWFYILYNTIGRDIRAGYRFGLLNLKLWRYERTNQTVAKVFARVVARHPEKTAFYFEEEKWTFQQVENFSNQLAHYFRSEGLVKGDVVALLLESKPEYVCIWLGLSKIGVVSALINSNLVSDPLIHCVKVANAKGLIFGSNFKQTVNEAMPKLPAMKYYQLSDSKLETELLEQSIDLRKEISKQSEESPVEMKKGCSKDKLLFIYTSGTTGLPKAAVITNMRYFFMALGLKIMTRLKRDDILYDPLPLYHSAGGMVGIGQCLLDGTTVAIRKKFSATGFWSDCIKYKCTAAQYIGEICRYILAANHKNGLKLKHSVKKLIGNGLRPQIWDKFVKQFNINEIYEFYGATEGNSNLINIDSTMGAVGFIPRYANLLYPVTLIKCNESTGEPIRGLDGFCIRCQPGESGVFIGKVNRGRSVNDFSGYADEKANEKKLLRDVFKAGDLFFHSGDILVQDELGYFFFKDRTGDTFRWKGENVATSEVEAVISNVVDLTDALVYGVEIPGNEGRAGMLAIVDTNNSLDVTKLCKGLKENLPAYAVPIFVRVLHSAPITGTFKLQKMDLQKEGFDMNKVKNDKLYVYDPKNVCYAELTQEKYDEIMSGNVRL